MISGIKNYKSIAKKKKKKNHGKVALLEKSKLNNIEVLTLFKIEGAKKIPLLDFPQ